MFHPYFPTNNIKRIRRCIRLLCENYGEKRTSQKGVAYFDFPTPDSLAKAQVEDLYACGLGYRSRYLYETANSVVHDEINLDKLWELDYDAAKKELVKLCGIGTKVADCICLCALHKQMHFLKIRISIRYCQHNIQMDFRLKNMDKTVVSCSSIFLLSSYGPLGKILPCIYYHGNFF